MTTMRFRRLTVFPVLLVGLMAFPPLALAEDAAKAETSELSGRILDASEHPLASATLVAYHLSTEQIFRSQPTNANGEYAISGLPYGYFDIAVETSAGVYVATQVVNVAPSSKTVVTLSLGAPGSGTNAATRAFPGTDATPIGVAQLKEKLGRKDFWSSPKGVGILAAGGGVLLLAIASGGGSSSNNASPSSR